MSKRQKRAAKAAGLSPAEAPRAKQFKQYLGADVKAMRRLARWLKIAGADDMPWLELARAIDWKTNAAKELERIHGR